jgi:hypothetical protein
VGCVRFELDSWKTIGTTLKKMLSARLSTQLRACHASRLLVRGYAASTNAEGKQGAAVKTFANQDKIPRLPIPPLNQTITKYLESCKPLLSEKEMEATRKAAAEFIKEGTGFAHVLQKRLQDLDKSTKV